MAEQLCRHSQFVPPIHEGKLFRANMKMGEHSTLFILAILEPISWRIPFAVRQDSSFVPVLGMKREILNYRWVGGGTGYQLLNRVNRPV